MKNRSNFVFVTKESQALKDLRFRLGFSLVRTSDLMKLSFVLIHQMESGREDITDSYIELFLNSLEINREEWLHQLTINDEKALLLNKCQARLNSLNAYQLEQIYGLLCEL